MDDFLIISKSEFESFKKDLIDDILSVIQTKESRNFLRSSDVKKLLKISDSTLQSMRIKGVIPAYKIGTTWFYKLEEICSLLENSKSNLKGKDKL